MANYEDRFKLDLIAQGLVQTSSRARFFASTTQAISGHIAINFAGDDYNIGGGFTRINASSWTVNFTGLIIVNCQAYNGGTGTPSGARIGFRVSGVEQGTGTGGWAQNGLSATAILEVTSGQSIDVNLLSNAGQTLQANSTFVTFTRVSDYEVVT